MDIRTAKTKEAMKTAMLDLLHFKKFDEITIKEITMKANVSRLTFYTHYDDKYSIYSEIVKDVLMSDIKEIIKKSDMKKADASVFCKIIELLYPRFLGPFYCSTNDMQHWANYSAVQSSVYESIFDYLCHYIDETIARTQSMLSTQIVLQTLEIMHELKKEFDPDLAQSAANEIIRGIEGDCWRIYLMLPQITH